MLNSFEKEKIRRTETNLRGTPVADLRKLYISKHRVICEDGVNQMIKAWLVSDLLRLQYGDRRMDAYWGHSS